MSADESHWHRATFDCSKINSLDELECLALELVDSLGGYTEIQVGKRFTYYWDQRKVDLATFEAACVKLNLAPAEIQEVPTTNWTQQCSDLLEPVRAGSLTIQPYLEAPHTPKVDRKEIAIIPGLGFGTGHHDTTRSIIEFLSDMKADGQSFRSCLDIGTGSGILAIAAAKLFDTSVDAIDNDPDAVANALENVSINGCQKKIEVTARSLSEYRGPYDLILANIYAEVLVSFRNEFDRLSKTGTVLVVSGVTNEKKTFVEEHITSSNVWRTALWRSFESFSSGCFERVQ